MGVPRLFPWLCKNFKNHVENFQQGESRAVVDALYLDANPLLHYATQYVNNTIDPPRMIDIYAQLSEKEKMLKAFELFFEKIVELTEIVIPTKILYIAIDGPAPRAKQNQQRERRFVSAKIRKEKEESRKNTKEKIFNNSQLTPGTLFMHELMKFVNYSIRKEMNKNKAWKGLDVYFSPCSSPGEGEHKCLDFIRGLPEDKRINYKHCIFGPDGDLIMLTLSAHVPNIFLFREDQYNPGYIHFLDMGSIAKELPKALSLGNRRVYDVINDFLVLGFFVGNDFLPKIQMFHLLEDGLELMIRTYERTSNGGRGGFLTEKGELNYTGFKEFINALASHEKSYLIKQISNTNPKKQPPEEKFINKTLKECLIYSEAGSVNIDFDRYKLAYYEKSFGNEITEDKIRNMCRSYFKTFVWILKYYIFGLASWGWAYEYHYAPLMFDFKNYVNSITDSEELFKFDMGQPSLPFEQLISVLPETSAYLLPKKFGDLLVDSPLVKKGYYPPLNQLKIDYEGKLKEHEGVVILPFVDYEDVKNAYTKVKTNIKNYHRNLQGKYPPSKDMRNYTLYKFNYILGGLPPNKEGLNYKSDYGSLFNIFIVKNIVEN